IRKHLPGDEGFEIVAECDDGFKAVSTIERTKPDLLILDIQMPGLDGFGVLRMLEGAVPPAIIFVTAFDRYAVAAFEVHAIDYLLKPVSPERLAEALERSKSVLQRKASQETAAQLLGLLKDMRRYPDWLLIKTNGRSHFVRVRDIDWIESKRNNVVLHVGTAAHHSHPTTPRPDGENDPSPFLRTHPAAIVNVERPYKLPPRSTRVSP